MVDKGELIDLNNRIENFEKLADEFAHIFSEDIDDASGIEKFAREMEELRKNLDEDLKHHRIKKIHEDVKKLDIVDKKLDEHMINDLKREAKAIDKELRDIVSQ